MGEITVISTNSLGIIAGKIIKLNCDLTLYTKIINNSKSIKDINVKAKTIKFSEGHFTVNLYDLGLSNGLRQATKSTSNQKKKIK